MSNADLAQPFVALELDKPRKFCLDWNAICIIERITGKNALVDANMWTKPDATFVRALVFAGLNSDDPTLTLEQAGQLVTKYGWVITTALESASKMIQATVSAQKKSV